MPPILALALFMNAIDRRRTLAASMILGGLSLLLMIPFYYFQGGISRKKKYEIFFVPH